MIFLACIIHEIKFACRCHLSADRFIVKALRLINQRRPRRNAGDGRIKCLIMNELTLIRLVVEKFW